MCDGHHGHITTAGHRTELYNGSARPVHSVPYRAGTAARQSVVIKIDRMPQKISSNQ